MIRVRVIIPGEERVIENSNINNFTDFIISLLQTKKAKTEKLDLTSRRFFGTINNIPVAMEEVGDGEMRGDFDETLAL